MIGACELSSFDSYASSRRSDGDDES